MTATSIGAMAPTLLSATGDTDAVRIFTAGTRRLLGGDVGDSRRFWARQVVRLVIAVMVVLGTVSIWVTPQTNLSTAIGLVTAGLAFALQKVIVALAGYFVILRRHTFSVGDRITIGGCVVTSSGSGSCAPP